MKLTLCMWYQSSPVESSTDRSIINSETVLPAPIPHNGNSAPRRILSSYRIQLMFMNACNIYITYFHHYQSMSSINYTHFIITINNKHVHIYITSFNIINHQKTTESHHKVYTVPNSTQTGIPTESYTSSNFPEKSQNRNFTHSPPYAYHY